jgi:hypothetical protein
MLIKNSKSIGKILPIKIEMLLLRCPCCKGHNLNIKSYYKSLLPAVKIRCTSCNSIFVIEWMRGEKSPEERKVNKMTVIYIKKIKLWMTRESNP